MKNTRNVLTAFVLGLFVFAPAFVSVAHAADLGDDFGDMGGVDFYDTSLVDNVDYYDTSSMDNVDYYDTSAYDNVDYYDTSAYDNVDYYDTSADYDHDGYVETWEYQESYGGGRGGGMPSFGGGSSYGGSSIGRGTSYSYPSTPMTFYTPTYHAPQQPTVITNTSNNCVNNSCNNIDNSVTNIVNSGNTTATVYPVEPQYQVQYVQPTYQRPYCTITINYNNSTNYGPYSNQLATLTWSSTGATSGYISPIVGSVSAYGSMTVYPTNGQIYTMTVYGQGGTATCQTTSYYAPIVQTPTPYVSLSQIPYTGFDFGTVGNAIYWLALAAFAGAAAYLVLYFQGGMLAIFGSRAKRPQAEMPKISVSKAPQAAAPVAHAEAPVISPIQLATSKTTSDSMMVKFSKAGEAPRIVISRE